MAPQTPNNESIQELLKKIPFYWVLAQEQLAHQGGGQKIHETQKQAQNRMFMTMLDAYLRNNSSSLDAISKTANINDLITTTQRSAQPTGVITDQNIQEAYSAFSDILNKVINIQTIDEKKYEADVQKWQSRLYVIDDRMKKDAETLRHDFLQSHGKKHNMFTLTKSQVTPDMSLENIIYHAKHSGKRTFDICYRNGWFKHDGSLAVSAPPAVVSAFNNPSDEELARRQFIEAHQKNYNEAAGFFSRTKVKETDSLETILTRALDNSSSRNRSRDVCIELGWLEKSGNETKLSSGAPQTVKNLVGTIKEKQEALQQQAGRPRSVSR